MRKPFTSFNINTQPDGQLLVSEVLADYRLACESRAISILGRKDVFMGRAKFGIFGDGKELAQIALSKFFKKGDFRSGYYRDQTWLVAGGLMTWQQFFAQLYAHADIKHDIFTGGRSMNGHYGNAWIDENGNWLSQTSMKNSVVDVSSTAGQIPRSLGLAYASKLYREVSLLKNFTEFSKGGNEISFASIGDASTSQGMFWETMNAAGVLQVPLVVSVWDDGYGISVPIEYQTTKSSISEALGGLEKKSDTNGIKIFKVQGWDYEGLMSVYGTATAIARKSHIPVLIHVSELTQQLGHSASGSHERYKSSERLQWELDFDCNLRFRNYILENELASEAELLSIEQEAEKVAKNARKEAWDAVRRSINSENNTVKALIQEALTLSSENNELKQLNQKFEDVNTNWKRDGLKALKILAREVHAEKLHKKVLNQLHILEDLNQKRYSSQLYSEYPTSPLKVKEVKPRYSADSPMVDGRTVINKFFDITFSNNPLVFAIGEDIGKIGDVNQGFAGLQEKYGDKRITDVGIRETTIIGQGIGAAMRGLRPIVEVQYFDYIYYALACLTDDLACLHYRSVGQQRAPLIVRTRGHRLEGIWHSGSPMSVMIHALRGMHIISPRNFVKAAGFYNTLLKGDDPGLIIESLNGYRLKEKLPDNIGEICEPLGVPEILRGGKDITVVTYGSMCRIVMEAAEMLEKVGIDIEVIDVQTLVPWDLPKVILNSIKKTSRVIFADEDMPGGASAYMMQQVLDEQDAYHYLDSKPVTVSAQAHRPAYSSDGDYFSKPNPDTIFDAAYELMREAQPQRYKKIY